MKSCKKVLCSMLVIIFTLAFVQMAGAASLQIVTKSLPDATVGVDYRETLTAEGTGLQWQILEGKPDWLSLSSSGVLSGRPTQTGTYSFVVVAYSSSSVSGYAASFTIKVNAAPLPVVITTEYLSNGTVGVDYLDILTANTSGVTWSVSGNFPSFLTLDATTGKISGLPPAEGSYTFTVTASAAGMTPVSKPFTIKFSTGTFSFLNDTLSPATETRYYNAQFIASTTGVTWSRLNGKFPSGLELSSSGGTLSGTLARGTEGVYSFEIVATKGSVSISKWFTLTVNPDTSFTINTTDLSDGYVGQSYAESLSASAQATWTHTGGSLPIGLYLLNSGYIYGTPEYAGTYTFQATATASSGATASAWFTINVNTASSLSIITTNVKTATRGSDYSYAFQATQPSGVFWTAEGELPEGLTLNYSSGVLQGTTNTQDGFYNFTVTAYYNGQTASRYYTMKVVNSGESTGETDETGSSTVKITTTSIRNPEYNVQYYQRLEANITSGVTWTDEGGLPNGIVLDPSSGALVGVPTREGTYTFWVRATVSETNYDRKSFTVVVGREGYGDGSDSGCNSGMGILALALLGGLAGIKRR